MGKPDSITVITETASKLEREQEHFDQLATDAGEAWWGHKTPAGKMRLERRARMVVAALEDFPEPNVLEIGCGAGALSGAVLQERPHLSLNGCDISPQSIKLAHERYGEYPFANFEVADISSLSYEDESFDAVIGNSILHHVAVVDALQETFRVLKPGGVIWFSEPNLLNPQIAVERKLHFIGKRLQNSADETAFFRWSLARTLAKIGFSDGSVRSFDFLHPMVPSCLIGALDHIGKFVERLPILREVSGSLLIQAWKPANGS